MEAGRHTVCSYRVPVHTYLGTSKQLPMGRFRYIVSRVERRRFVRNSVWAFNPAPAFPRGAPKLCSQLCMGISHRRYTENGLLRYEGS